MTASRSVILLCAHQELVLAVRSRWTQIFAAIFAALSLAVAASGYVLSGGAGMQDFARTAASLVQLVLLLTPLTSLVIGVLALAPERGSAEMLFSQPVSRRSILFGRLLGLFAALAAAQAIGLGGAGLLVFSRAGGTGAAGYGILFLGALVLTAVFLGIAALLVSGGVGRRAKSLAVALIVWFGAVVLFDVAALGAASLLGSRAASRLLIGAVLVNPIDAFRTGRAPRDPGHDGLRRGLARAPAFYRAARPERRRSSGCPRLSGSCSRRRSPPGASNAPTSEAVRPLFPPGRVEDLAREEEQADVPQDRELHVVQALGVRLLDLGGPEAAAVDGLSARQIDRQGHDEHEKQDRRESGPPSVWRSPGTGPRPRRPPARAGSAPAR